MRTKDRDNKIRIATVKMFDPFYDGYHRSTYNGVFCMFCNRVLPNDDPCDGYREGVTFACQE